MPTGSGPTSPTPPNNTSGVDKNSGSKLSTMSYDPTPYIQRARVTRPAPPKPSVNPMQFVQIKPCSLYQSAQEQLKRAEEVKKVKEIKKEEPEDWQSNLDNWKSSRRKRVEHIIDRVVEVKKLEMEEHDRTRRKSKTFSEMLEERGSRRKLSALAVYTEDESNDFSDLGIGMSSASGKSSLSEDYDNHSVMSDNVDTEKPAFDTDNNSNHGHENGSGSRDYISSPGYDTSSSTAPASSPDPCEYTYEGAIQDYKTRVSRAQSGCYNNGFRSPYSKDSTPERSTSESYLNRHISSSKIEDRLLNFEVKCINEHSSENTSVKKDLPKVDILKRRELFEKESTTHTEVGNQKRFSGDFSQSKSIRERLSSLGKKSEDTKKSTRLPGDIVNIKDRLQNLEKQSTISEKPTKIDVPVLPLKDRLSSLQSAVAKEEVKKPVLLVDEHQLEILKKEELEKQHHLKREAFEDENLNSSQEILNINDELNLDTDREDSGIHTTDVSCSVSQTDEQPDLVNEESHHHINEDNLYQTQQQRVDVNDNQSKVNKATIPDVVCNVDPKNTTNSTKKEVPEKEPPSISREPVIDREASVDEALEMALQAIDNENSDIGNNSVQEDQTVKKEKEQLDTNAEPLSATKSSAGEPIYENVEQKDQKINTQAEQSQASAPKTEPTATPASIQLLTFEDKEEEPYYQVPKSSEPYYEVPKCTKPVPVYENIEIFYSGSPNKSSLSMTISALEPPKEKPPPPPMEELVDDEEDCDNIYERIKQNLPNANSKENLVKKEELNSKNDSIKRMNSTKRIKKELRNKRSSFLGIEGSNDDDSFLELTVAPPPDMAQLLQEERRLEKQLYMKAGLYDSSDTGESRDSGVSENHSRQSSEPFTTSSEEHEDLLGKKEKEIIEVLEKEEEKRRTAEDWSRTEDNNKIRCIEEQIREQEEVLRVERELLQLEQEELKRQRENLILRENRARRELEHGAKMLMSANRHSLQDINSPSFNYYPSAPNKIYQVDADYRKSMSDLHDCTQKRVPPAPPAKPLRSHVSVDGKQNGLFKTAYHAKIQLSQSTDEFVPQRNYQPASALHHGNMSRHTLHALSAAPKPKYSDGWIQQKSVDKPTENWLSFQQKRKSVPEGFNYNKHWLIQEAEQRRIDQQRGLRNNTANGWGSLSAIHRNGSSDNKPLPDAVIQTLTQRVQSKGIGERKKLEAVSSDSNICVTPTSSAVLNPLNTPSLQDGQPQDKILSVSGKKKCSHCGEELGRGAAMIIESLRLFYHINCFKCCVCHVQLGDGLNGTDVRVRNHKLHCQNCYSSDDGIKFSCV